MTCVTESFISGKDWQKIKSDFEKGGTGVLHVGDGGVLNYGEQTIVTATGEQAPLSHFGFMNIAGKDADLLETSGTTFKQDIADGAMGQFGVPLIGGISSFKFKANVKGTTDELFINGAKEADIDPKSTSTVLVIHNEGKCCVIFSFKLMIRGR